MRALVSCAIALLLGCDGGTSDPAGKCAELCVQVEECSLDDGAEDAEWTTGVCEESVASLPKRCRKAFSSLADCFAGVVDCQAARDGEVCFDEALDFHYKCYEQGIWCAEDVRVAAAEESLAVCCDADDYCNWADDNICQCDAEWEGEDCFEY